MKVKIQKEILTPSYSAVASLKYGKPANTILPSSAFQRILYRVIFDLYSLSRYTSYHIPSYICKYEFVRYSFALHIENIIICI